MLLKWTEHIQTVHQVMVLHMQSRASTLGVAQWSWAMEVYDNVAQSSVVLTWMAKLVKAVQNLVLFTTPYLCHTITCLQLSQRSSWTHFWTSNRWNSTQYDHLGFLEIVIHGKLPSPGWRNSWCLVIFYTIMYRSFSTKMQYAMNWLMAPWSMSWQIPMSPWLHPWLDLARFWCQYCWQGQYV